MGGPGAGNMEGSMSYETTDMHGNRMEGTYSTWQSQSFVGVQLYTLPV